jgi:hypothetical protein
MIIKKPIIKLSAKETRLGVEAKKKTVKKCYPKFKIGDYVCWKFGEHKGTVTKRTKDKYGYKYDFGKYTAYSENVLKKIKK